MASHRNIITSNLKTDLLGVSVANGYNNDFANVYRWKTYPISEDKSLVVTIKDGINSHSLDEGYKEILNIEISASFVLPQSTVDAEEEAYYQKADSVIEDIIKCLYDNESSFNTALDEGGFMFQVQSDEIDIEMDESSALSGGVTVVVEAVHKILETWELD